ncbi:DUF3558 family protein [Corynebacterium gallinarum]|uniref:DUF3558 domain-containing protein n=1 Tax=Corynebacterium gallinarum TaxID=2762214 RepID=A0A8I0HHF5_9CORY|nr:DUF3558 family protein [Corynebacterium gallinarum]MBD8029080.1 DUF3558 domain-containing protein [Corynebacterium gallinarum]
MHRTGPILLAAVALLTGCSPGSSTPATVTVPSPAPAAATSSAESTTPTDPGIFASQFHPCEVFTEEQFAEAGLGVRSRAAEDPQSVVKSCGFGLPGPNDVGGNVLVATDRISWSEVAAQGLEPEYWSETEIEGVYTHKMPGQIRRCGAAIDVEWGRLLISYQEFGEGWDRSKLCSHPVEILKYLITQSGGIDAAQSR